MDLSLLASLLLVFSLVLVSWLRSRNLPPGPWGLPLVGHLHLLHGSLPTKAINTISQKFGPIVHLRLGMIPTVIISSPDLAREVLAAQDANFSSRPYSVYGEYAEYGFAGFAGSPYGEHYRSIRKLCATDLFGARSINSFSWARAKELSHLFKVVLSCHSKNEAVDLRSCLSVFTFNVVTQMVCSKSCFSHDGSDVDPDSAEFKDLTRQAMALAVDPCLSNFVPSYLRWLDWKIPQYKRLREKQDKILQKIVDEHRSSSRECKDFVDMLLIHFGDGAQAETYTKALIMDMITGGTDSSASISECVLAAVMHNPRVMKKAQQELDKVVGQSRTASESDLPELEYLQAVIKETLRCLPMLLFPRVSECDTKVGGYDIPKGTTLIVNLPALATDPSIWENPSEFRPERFLENSIDIKIQNFEFLPFGAGRRKCPGMTLGTRHLELLAASLIHGFDWRFESSATQLPSMEEVLGRICQLKEPIVRVIATPRLPEEAYTT